MRVFAALLVLWATPLRADVSVVTDIAPVHSLVLSVLGEGRDAHLLIPAATSPHDAALRPSDARALSEADVVIWIGHALTPSLEDSVETLAAGALHLSLLEAEGTILRPVRKEEDHGEEDHDHAHDHGHDHGHDHDGAFGDPHAWLDPENAKLWLTLIADALGQADPANAALYAANADAARAELSTLIGDVTAQLAPKADRKFVVFHDAYHHFEDRFGLSFAGSIALSDAEDPSPARLRALQDTLAEQDVACVFSEPQFPDGLVRTVTEGAEVGRGVLDPLGTTLTPGATFYPSLIRNLANAFDDCL